MSLLLILLCILYSCPCPVSLPCYLAMVSYPCYSFALPWWLLNFFCLRPFCLWLLCSCTFGSLSPSTCVGSDGFHCFHCYLSLSVALVFLFSLSLPGWLFRSLWSFNLYSDDFRYCYCYFSLSVTCTFGSHDFCFDLCSDDFRFSYYYFSLSVTCTFGSDNFRFFRCYLSLSVALVFLFSLALPWWLFGSLWSLTYVQAIFAILIATSLYL